VSELHVEALGGGRYRVTGGRGSHIVTVGPTTARCDCADMHYRRRRCKHLSAVVDYLVLVPVETKIEANVGAGPGLECDVPLPEGDA
jgi:hypothetical protein